MSDPEESSSFSDEDDSYDESENLEFIQQPAEGTFMWQKKSDA